MKFKNTLKSRAKSAFATVGAVGTGLMLSGMASAASILPSTFATDMDGYKADIVTVGGAILALALVVFGFRYVKAALGR